MCSLSSHWIWYWIWIDRYSFFSFPQSKVGRISFHRQVTHVSGLLWILGEFYVLCLSRHFGGHWREGEIWSFLVKCHLKLEAQWREYFTLSFVIQCVTSNIVLSLSLLTPNMFLVKVLPWTVPFWSKLSTWTFYFYP